MSSASHHRAETKEQLNDKSESFMAGQNGGARQGAGRPKGVTSPKRRKTEAVLAAFAASGDMTPLEVMLAVMKQAIAEKDTQQAMYAANSAAPYVHSKLASATINGTLTATVAVKIVDDTTE